MAAIRLAKGQDLEHGAGTVEGARAANAEYHAHEDLKIRADALEKEAGKNDRNVRDLGRARDALYGGETERSARLLDKVGLGEYDEHDSFQEDYLKSAPTGADRSTEHWFATTHHGSDLSLSDTLSNVHEEDLSTRGSTRKKESSLSYGAIKKGLIR